MKSQSKHYKITLKIITFLNEKGHNYNKLDFKNGNIVIEEIEVEEI